VKKVSVPLDVERELRYSINAIVELEERFNSPVTELFKEGRIGLALIRAVAYIGLKHGGMKFRSQDTKENEATVGELIQEHWLGKGRNLNELVEKITEASTFTICPSAVRASTESSPRMAPSSGAMDIV